MVHVWCCVVCTSRMSVTLSCELFAHSMHLVCSRCTILWQTLLCDRLFVARGRPQYSRLNLVASAVALWTGQLLSSAGVDSSCRVH